MSRIFDAFLTQQYEEALALEAVSDRVELLPMGGPPPDRYVVRFHCRGLVCRPGGEVETADQFALGIRFPPDYLHVANPFEVLTWFAPENIFHPNIGPGPGGMIYICIGQISAGTSLIDLVEQCFEVITYQKVTMREDDAVSREACVWARQNQHRFPVDSGGLRRRTIDLQVESVDGGTP